MEDRLAQPMAVHVVGVKIPFLDLVLLLVKLALAMLPALFIRGLPAVSRVAHRGAPSPIAAGIAERRPDNIGRSSLLASTIELRRTYY